MIRWMSLVFGFGLLLLWFVGMGTPVNSTLVWLDLAAALGAFFIAGAVTARSSRPVQIGAPLGFSAVLYGLWVAALLTDTVNWLAWWNFGFASGFLILGIRAWTEPRAYRLNFDDSIGRLRSGSTFGTWPSRYPYAPWGWFRHGEDGFGDAIYQSQPGRYSGIGPSGYRRNDSRIEEELNERLTEDGALDATEIVAVVTNGDVVLQGAVENRRMRRRAEEVAEAVAGVRNVDNRLFVKKKAAARDEFRAA